MPIIVTSKHADITAHDSVVDALADYIDCIDNIGLEMYWVDKFDPETMVRPWAPSGQYVAPGAR